MRHLSLPEGPLKLVCLAAHPDDVEIAAGATLLSLAERGGVQGHWLTRGRAATGRLPAHWNELKDILHTFAAALPDADVVLAPRMDDAHQDHRLLGTMAC